MRYYLGCEFSPDTREQKESIQTSTKKEESHENDFFGYNDYLVVQCELCATPIADITGSS